MEDRTLIDIKERIEDDFTYHSPSGDQPQRYEELRAKARELAKMINSYCEHPAPYFIVNEKMKALEKLEECIMWANASVARNG